MNDKLERMDKLVDRLQRVHLEQSIPDVPVEELIQKYQSILQSRSNQVDRDIQAIDAVRNVLAGLPGRQEAKFQAPVAAASLSAFDQEKLRQKMGKINHVVPKELHLGPKGKYYYLRVTPSGRVKKTYLNWRMQKDFESGKLAGCIGPLCGEENDFRPKRVLRMGPLS